MTADDAVDFATTVTQGNDGLRKRMGANASVRYTVLAHPDLWKKSSESFSPGPRRFFQEACDGYFRTLFPGKFPGDPLADGAAIMGHDAIVTLIAAIRTREGIKDRPNLIIQEFNRMHGLRAIAGGERLNFAGRERQAHQQGRAHLGGASRRHRCVRTVELTAQFAVPPRRP